MTSRKERLTVTVDRDLLEAAYDAVGEGRVDSLSAWVNRALKELVIKERRLAALREALASYEAEFGEISDAEMVMQKRRDSGAAVVVRPATTGRAKPRRGRGVA